MINAFRVKSKRGKGKVAEEKGFPKIFFWA